MSKTNRRTAAPARPKTPPPSSVRSPAEQMLARSALLARKVLASEADHEAPPQPVRVAFAGSLLTH